MVVNSLRSWLHQLRQEGKLKYVNREVDRRYELAAVSKKADGLYCLQFNHVRGSNIPVVTNIAHSRDLIALALGVRKEKLAEHFAWAQGHPGQCQLIPPGQAPVKSKIMQPDLRSLPIVIHHEKDGGAFITAGLLIAKDPETGIRNVSIHRLQMFSPKHLGILMLPRHLRQIYQKAEAMNAPLDIAIVIGVDPIPLLASQAQVPLGYDEFAVAAALYGQPFPMVRCETVNLEVPAQAEIVLEGRMLPHVRHMEGPFGEFPKTYTPSYPKPMIELTAMTTRNNPIYHTIVPASNEHFLIGGIPREGGLFETMSKTVTCVRHVRFTPGGTCRFHAIVSIAKKSDEEPKNAILAAINGSQDIKHIVIVDQDINIFNNLDVEWAIATRTQAARDVIIARDLPGNLLDPSARNSISDKMGIDATVPLGHYERFAKMHIPGEEKIVLNNYLSN
ncbi:UbiD family decarboxylase [Desulfosporosinus sp. FKA]|uniref:UbiD family decarboxylase n=1 Tax=Desulfosporosinus sp. FKA TaxID=1969834 RepID=UPI000B49E82F|nr:UbiD family decarboxylase [Desulfosporosinus sp. FKA]